jgi:transposase
MIFDDVTAEKRELIIKQANKTKNISETCRYFEISRTAYYKWLERYNKYGFEGLKDKIPSKPKMPNQTPAEIENKILLIAKSHPEYGPQRIAHELGDEGIKISNTGVYKVLKRNGLEKKELRWFYSKKER